MAKSKKVETPKKSPAEAKQKEIQFLKGLYGDFKTTMTEVLGDSGEFIMKHKVLLILAFLAFLLYRNKMFSIQRFVDELEKRLVGKKQEEDW
jgi:hypothetical protein